MRLTIGAEEYLIASEKQYDESSKKSIDSFSGQKIWECSHDLCLMLQRVPLAPSTRVLELGCGHGLPGLICLSKGCQVHFQDYSHETIENVTRQTILLNQPSKLESCSFSSGEWSNFESDSLFDVILCCEGIYSTENFPALKRIIMKFLKPGNSSAYFAGKKYYFGCGGGTMSFGEFVAPEFHCEAVEKIQDGKSNIREIIKVTRCPAD